MAARIRAVVEMITGRFSAGASGTVDLTEWLELTTTQAEAKRIQHAFLKWWWTISSVNCPFELAWFEAMKMVPLEYCGWLSDFSRFVDEVTDLSRTLLHAADVLERDGWVQGSVGTYTYGYDLLGAVEVATKELAVSKTTGYATRVHKAWIASLTELRNYIGTAALAAWNDSPSRTQREVVATLKACGERVAIVQP